METRIGFIPVIFEDYSFIVLVNRKDKSLISRIITVEETLVLAETQERIRRIPAQVEREKKLDQELKRLRLGWLMSFSLFFFGERNFRALRDYLQTPDVFATLSYFDQDYYVFACLLPENLFSDLEKGNNSVERIVIREKVEGRGMQAEEVKALERILDHLISS